MQTINGCTVITAGAEGVAALESQHTGGAYSLLIGTIPAGTPAPPLHVHPTTDEAFYLASGTAGFRLGDQELTLAAGSLVFVPRGTAHTAWNAGDDATQGLILISPTDVEHEFVPVPG